MSAEFCEMGSTLWLDAFGQGKYSKGVQSTEILQNALRLAADRDNKIEEFIGRKRSEAAFIEKLITERKKYNTSQETEEANCIRMVSERKSTIIRIKSEIKSLEIQEKKLSEDFKHFSTTLKRQRDALVITNSYFRDRLECYIELASPNDDTFIVVFFSSDKKETYDYFVKIKWDAEKIAWTVEEMRPKVSGQSAISRKLARTGDIQGFLYHVRKLYLGLKSNQLKF